MREKIKEEQEIKTRVEQKGDEYEENKEVVRWNKIKRNNIGRAARNYGRIKDESVEWDKYGCEKRKKEIREKEKIGIYIYIMNYESFQCR